MAINKEMNFQWPNDFHKCFMAIDFVCKFYICFKVV